MNASVDQYQGCILGLALGDAIGAPFEGGLIERSLWKLIGRVRDHSPRWTDDTQMSLDVANVLLRYREIDQDRLAEVFAGSYAWSRGYGPGTARQLKLIKSGVHWREARIRIFKDGSFGNGAAMRSAPVSLFFYNDFERLVAETKKAAEITHSHPLAIQGALAISIAVHFALQSRDCPEMWRLLQEHCASPVFLRKIGLARGWIDSKSEIARGAVAKVLGNGMTAQDSVVTAIYAATRFMGSSFGEMMGFIISLGGDVDTIGAMAGAIWGAANGSVTLENLPIEEKDRLKRVAIDLYRKRLAPCFI
ncbi:ADP-ribosylglycohydrolase family protein [uncultured Thiodictyon sp.]|uniref:ADP-ribosylglycohydrolase family protein n=1 Tax=uncultured Thiodictyon sp. TaxID=1846217 RepID=UPI0025D12DDB|nr:ADP-ribosylglycohydrolase family protein [uncultured Thiodictyon sp.]